MADFTLRPACAADLPALTAIYNEAVLHTTATFDLEEKTEAERADWLRFHLDSPGYPLLVAVTPAGEAAGYASLSPYRDKEAYRSTAEVSVYIGSRFHRQGAATLLMAELIRLARADAQLHLLVSVITAGNEASTRLHRRFGFTLSGTLPHCGRKFGQWLGVETWYLAVD